MIDAEMVPFQTGYRFDPLGHRGGLPLKGQGKGKEGKASSVQGKGKAKGNSKGKAKGKSKGKLQGKETAFPWVRSEVEERVMGGVRTHMVIEMDMLRRNAQLHAWVEALVERMARIERIDTDSEDGEDAGQADEAWRVVGHLGHRVRLIMIEYRL